MIARLLSRLSASIAVVEKIALMFLILAIFCFVLMNVVLRVFGVTIAWADEVAVYSMILSGFLGASLMLRARIDPAVLLLHAIAPPAVVQVLHSIVSFIAAVFGISLIYMSWLWFNPMALAVADFDIFTFEGTTFNFIYTDSTPVMGLPLFYLYLIIPVFAITVTVHAITNLAEDLGLVKRPDGLARSLQAEGYEG